VVLQDDVEVGEGAMLIGPTVVGRGGHISAGATVVQSVIGPGAVVAAGATLRHRLYLDAADLTESGPAEVSALAWVVPNGGEASTGFLSVEPRRRSPYLAVKRMLDATAAALGLVLLSPLALVIAALIKLESRGPVHFGHVREGMGGRAFRCWKFRTMIPDADQQQRKLAGLNRVDGPQFKVDRDPRRTRIGAVLSATNLDEIPQLWNVLVGEMSLVGPRPSPFRENQVCIPWREARLSVRPGITGLWQICRHDRANGDFHQWIYYDLLYLRNVSFWLDAKIASLTLLSFTRGGNIPLSWLLAPERYGERRGRARSEDTAPEAAPLSDHQATHAAIPPSRELVSREVVEKGVRAEGVGNEAAIVHLRDV
jgi:lipopolysaccharide/colanic/teichoic acid biosynthesis glycosyltransferase